MTNDDLDAAWAHQQLLEAQRAGRQRGGPQPGETNAMAKLRGADVIAMRLRYAEGDISYKELAELFNVTTMTAYRAVTGQNWSHL